MDFGDILLRLLFPVLCYLLPGALTIWNLYNCFAKKPKKEGLAGVLTVLIGGVLYLILFLLVFDQAGDWDVQILSGQFHNCISSRFNLFAAVILTVGFAGYFVLAFSDAQKLPPLVSVISIALLIVLNIFQIVFAIQIAKHAAEAGIFLYTYHFNILILSARAVKKHMTVQVAVMKEREAEFSENKRFGRLYRVLGSISGYSTAVFIALFLIFAVIEIVFVLAGQGLDAPVRMFTDTADWTFSKQIPPPPLEYDGHYLCTVAAGGDEKIVKPLRYGTRRGATIIVNRQLCVANAFEEVIQEKFPKFHRRIRHFYDTHGYPLSQIITTPKRADIVYFAMKPLEWIFLVFLYLTDARPEKRISRQYLYRPE